MPHRSLAHTADTGIEADAPDLPRLISELASGMFELMGDAGAEPGGTVDEVTVESDTVEDLVVDVLSELLYRAETRNLHYTSFTVVSAGETSITLRCRAVPVRTVAQTGPPIKAVTYHQLSVERTDGEWRARVYFDV